MNQPRFQVRSLLNDRPFDFFLKGGGGRVWVISENNILQRDFEGKKIIARKYLGK